MKTIERTLARSAAAKETRFVRDLLDLVLEMREAINGHADPVIPEPEPAPLEILGACMIAQNSSTSNTSLTKDIYSEFGGTYAAVGVPDSNLVVAGSGVGVQYTGDSPARLLVNVSGRFGYNGANVTYALRPHINGSAVADVTAEVYIASTLIAGTMTLSALLEIVKGDSVTLRVTNITDNTDLISRRLNATFTLLKVAA